MKKLTVVGNPIHHSLSPKIFQYWGKKYGVDLSYDKTQILPENFLNHFKTLVKSGYSGFNITMPYKEKILPILDDISETAKIIGAVNMIALTDEGMLYGDNTDYHAIKTAILTARVKNKIAIIFGAGGAAKAACKALLDLEFEQINIINRTPERADRLCAALGKRCINIKWEDRYSDLPHTNLFINATSVDLDAQHLKIDRLNPSALVIDFVYRANGTSFINNAQKRGYKTVNGLNLLLNQAQPCFKHWFGFLPEITSELMQILIANE